MQLKDAVLSNKRIVSGWETKLPKLPLGVEHLVHPEAIEDHRDEGEDDEDNQSCEEEVQTPKPIPRKRSKKNVVVRVPKRKKQKQVVVQEVSEDESAESEEEEDLAPLLKYTSGGFHPDIKVDPCDVGGFFVNGKHNGLFIGGHCTPMQLKQKCGGKKNFLISLQVENNTLIKWAKHHPVDLCGGVMRCIDTHNLLAKQFQPRGDWQQQQQQQQQQRGGGIISTWGNFNPRQSSPNTQAPLQLNLGGGRGTGQTFGMQATNPGLFQLQ